MRARSGQLELTIGLGGIDQHKVVFDVAVAIACSVANQSVIAICMAFRNSFVKALEDAALYYER